MSHDARYIAGLIFKHLEGNISEEESNVLKSWAEESAQNRKFFEELTDEELRKLVQRGAAPEDKILQKIRSGINESVEIARPVHSIPSLTGGRHFLKTTWFKYAAAILLIIGISTYLWNRSTKTEESKTVKTETKKKDILPGGQRALLTLADGSTIILDSAANGQLAIQGNSKIVKLEDGQLIYNSGSISSPFEKGGRGDVRSGETAGGFMNTMSTPRGGQYQLTLSDGTKVWLNAASSITYPTAFTNKAREVSITGEAYFEVTPNKSQPFIVKTIKEEITVLGTSFNINAYPDEPSSKTSLIEGSVMVTTVAPYPPLAGDVSPKAKRGWTLKPGEAFTNNKIIKTDITQDIAWKNGLFNFNDLPFDEAMRQLSRWYDVEIIYDKGIPKKQLKGKMDRNLTLRDALSGLDGIGARFTLEGRVVHVTAIK
ncbi:MAG: FecR family protein [Chitinophagaceae bacterium]|nr:FecR family protein [Chitinophagaceae bacterium]